MDVRQRWTHALTMAVAFGVPYAVFATAGRNQSFASGAVQGVVAGAVFGAGMTWLAHRNVRRLTLGLSQALNPAEVKQALAASVRGDVPQDQRVVAASAEISRRRLEMLDRRRQVNLGATVAVVLVLCVLAVVHSQLWWLAAGLFVLGALLSERQIRQLRERATILAEVSAALERRSGSPS